MPLASHLMHKLKRSNVWNEHRSVSVYKFCSNFVLFAQGFRLANNGGKRYSGKVEGLSNNKWFGLYAYYFEIKHQKRICNILGFPGSLRAWTYITKQKQLGAKITIWNGTKIPQYRVYLGGVTHFSGLTCKKGWLKSLQNNRRFSHDGRRIFQNPTVPVPCL